MVELSLMSMSEWMNWVMVGFMEEHRGWIYGWFGWWIDDSHCNGTFYSSSDVSVNLSVDSCPINDLPQKVPLNDMPPRKGPSINLPQKVNPADLAIMTTVNSDNVAAKKVTPSLGMPARNVGENIGGEESEYVGMGDLPIITKEGNVMILGAKRNL